MASGGIFHSYIQDYPTSTCMAHVISLVAIKYSRYAKLAFIQFIAEGLICTLSHSGYCFQGSRVDMYLQFNTVAYTEVEGGI